jgi:hypothetical protein
MKIKSLACIVAVSAFCAAPAFAQATGQGGDNTSGRAGASSESVESRKDQALKPAAPEKDGVTMYKGNVFVVQNGKMMRAPATKTEVADGLIVESDTIWKNGQKVTLTDGQMLTFDGNMIEAPQQIQDRASQTGQGAINDR